jgi:hypothetical protein
VKRSSRKSRFVVRNQPCRLARLIAFRKPLRGMQSPTRKRR